MTDDKLDEAIKRHKTEIEWEGRWKRFFHGVEQVFLIITICIIGGSVIATLVVGCLLFVQIAGLNF